MDNTSTHLMVNLGNLVPACQTILDFTAATDDDRGSGGTNWSSKTCKVLVKITTMSIPTRCFYKPDTLLTINRQCQRT